MTGPAAGSVDDPADAQALRAALVRELTGLRSGAWRDAFLAVPRHLFVGAFSHYDGHGEYEQITPAADRDRWLSLVYSDDSLVTHTHGDGSGASSSSTQPSVMAFMLDALQVRANHRVLEVGTGTGYNAALLCHRLSDRGVITVEVDPVVADEARAALARVGYHPQVITSDGLAGWEYGCPYDGVIGTCSTGRVPAAWLKQVYPGGRIVANVGVGVVPLVKADDGSASGRFLDEVASFIEARPAGAAEPVSIDDAVKAVYDWPDRTETFTELDGIDDEEFGFLVDVWLPGLSRFGLNDDEGDGRSRCLLDGASGSWARALTTRESGQRMLTETGPRRLWSELETVHTAWMAAGRPSHDRLGLTVHRDGTHTIWIADAYGRPGPMLAQHLPATAWSDRP